MKKGVFLILFIPLIIIIIILTGCTNNKVKLPTSASSNGCYDNCENKDLLKKDIQTIFGLNQSEYIIKCSECFFGRSAYVKSRILINGDMIELYHREGGCSSGGSDCGWSICFTSFSDNTRDLYESIKSKFCDKIYSKKIENDPSCGYNGTYIEDVGKKCQLGGFEEINGSRRTLSIVQLINRCEVYPLKGKTNCLEIS